MLHELVVSVGAGGSDSAAPTPAVLPVRRRAVARSCTTITTFPDPATLALPHKPPHITFTFKKSFI